MLGVEGRDGTDVSSAAAGIAAGSAAQLAVSRWNAGHPRICSRGRAIHWGARSWGRERCPASMYPSQGEFSVTAGLWLGRKTVNTAAAPGADS